MSVEIGVFIVIWDIYGHFKLVKRLEKLSKTNDKTNEDTLICYRNNM